MRIVSVVGTRPQLIKAAALAPVLRRDHDEVFVDTGQHWDEAMAGGFFRELDLPRPDHTLGVGGGTHGEQTARMLERLEPILVAERPDAVLVYGDTNSTLVGALAAAKLGIPVAHVEAGLRSFDRRMPEELNRVVADHLLDVALRADPRGRRQPGRRGHPRRRATRRRPDAGPRRAGRPPRCATRRRWRGSPPRWTSRSAPGGYAFATVHRAENRDPDAMRAWSSLLASVAADRPVVLALHPGTAAALEGAGIRLADGVHVVAPQGYRTTLALQLHAAAVLTDSGGVQREAAWLRTPCLILRDRTEWVEAVAESEGRMVIVGLDEALALRELARLADPREAPALAAERAATLDLAPAGAAEAISADPARTTRMSGPAPPTAPGRDVRRQRRLARHAGCFARPTPWRQAGHDVVLVARPSAGIELPTEERRPSGVRLVRIPRDDDLQARWRSLQQRAALSVAGARGPRPRVARDLRAGPSGWPRAGAKALATFVALPWIAYRLVAYGLARRPAARARDGVGQLDYVMTWRRSRASVGPRSRRRRPGRRRSPWPRRHGARRRGRRRERDAARWSSTTATSSTRSRGGTRARAGSLASGCGRSNAAWRGVPSRS